MTLQELERRYQESLRLLVRELHSAQVQCVARETALRTLLPDLGWKDQVSALEKSLQPQSVATAAQQFDLLIALLKSEAVGQAVDLDGIVKTLVESVENS